MRFSDLLSIWNALVGVKLSRVGPGSALEIVAIDNEGSRVIVSSEGRRGSRSFAELERVWEALKSKQVIHVDSELSGSGTSRNQPETLFAALPFVEYTTIRRKKHLVLVDSNSHAPGTLRRADAEKVEQILIARKVRSSAVTELVIPVPDIKSAADAMTRLTGEKPDASGPGEYVYNLGGLPVRLVTEGGEYSAYRGQAILRRLGSPNGALEQSVQIGAGVVVITEGEKKDLEPS